MKKMFFGLLVFLISAMNNNFAQSVKVAFRDESVQTKYAADFLQKTLSECGYVVVQNKPDCLITLKVDSQNLSPEAFEINPEKSNIVIKGGDGRGIIYGCNSLAEDLMNKIPLRKIQAKQESPRLPFRAIKFDLPWDTYRHSYALSLHQETCKDINYWKAFLDMMCRNRFNVLQLYNLHPYTFLIKPKNFPEASPWNDKEMGEWKKLFSGIFKLAKERGIDVYLVPFNIFVTPEFSKAHNVEMYNLEHDFFVKGDTSEIIKRYTRECVTQVLDEYPDLTGFGLTLGEGMAGMTPRQREDWIKETIIEGMRLANRKSKLIHRIPFSGNTGSLGETSIEMEKITRAGIEQEAALDCIEKPVWADLKFNWSHGHSTTKLIKVHGGKLYGTYFSPEPKDYKITWTVRNEDFFCLRWGVADFIRKHIKRNSEGYVGGYTIGSETYIPAKDYFTKPDSSINWEYAFERQWLFYKLWGRLLYNPDTPDKIFKDEFVRRYGKKASVLFEANSLAGKTLLRIVSSFDCTWDFTMYAEGFMALNPATKRVEYISVDRQINQPPLDTGYVSIAKYVEAVSSGKKIGKDKITPLELAGMLKNDCSKALNLIKNLNYKKTNPVKYEISDVKAWADLGLFFGEKIKGAVALQLYRTNGKEEYKRKAVKYLEKALSYWDKIIGITRPIYNDMPLVHYSEQDGKNWKENDHLRFHWALLRNDVLHDIEIAKNAVRIPVE
jgi:hypothetical protein